MGLEMLGKVVKVVVDRPLGTLFHRSRDLKVPQSSRIVACCRASSPSPTPCLIDFASHKQSFRLFGPVDKLLRNFLPISNPVDHTKQNSRVHKDSAISLRVIGE